MCVLVKGVEIPKNCEDCPMCHSNAEYDYAYCCVSSAETTGARRPSDCPLIELPDHGDLIDMSALNDAMFHEAFETDSDMQKWDSGCWIRYKMFEKHRDLAPVVIQAERSEK